MKALNAIRLIKKKLHKIFYSILYCNSEIWKIPTLKNTLKQSLLSASAKALRACIGNVNYNLSFINLRKICGRATPEMMMNYKLALCLYKLHNIEFNSIEFALLRFNQILTGRQTNFITLKSNWYKNRNNSLSNRLLLLNNKIPLDWLNLSMSTYK